MRNVEHDAASLQTVRWDTSVAEVAASPFSDDVDALLADLISQPSEISLPDLGSSRHEEINDEKTSLEQEPNNAPSREIPPEHTFTTKLDAPHKPTPLSGQSSTYAFDSNALEAGPMPARVYSFSDLTLFERLTGYRLAAQRQLWRAVDKEGNRSTAGDRLFTVLAEETFQMADRSRRNSSSPLADLTIHDIATALQPMRGIAAHLGGRGIEAWERLESVVKAAQTRPIAA